MLKFNKFILEKKCDCGPDCSCEGKCDDNCNCGPDCGQEKVDEALTMTQRMQRKRQMKKYASRIKIGREKAMRRMADPKRLKRRAQKQARNMIAKKLAKGSYSDLSFSRKQEIEKRLDKMQGKVSRLAKKMLPKIRKSELEKKRG